MATGWLGWSPDVALTTPIPQIILARDGLVDWHRLLNGEKPESMKDQKPPVSERLVTAFRALGAKKAGESNGDD